MNEVVNCSVCGETTYPKIDSITVCVICASTNYLIKYQHDPVWMHSVFETVRNWGGDRYMSQGDQAEVLAIRNRFCHQCLQLH